MTAVPEPPRDDLGHPVPVTRPARRVVSLVPSLTESVAAARPEALVGVTDWCTHPPGLQATRVRGTKNPNLAAIAEPAARYRARQPGGEPPPRRGPASRGRDTGLGDGHPDPGRGHCLPAADVHRGPRLARAGLARRGGPGMAGASGGSPVAGGHPGVARPLDGRRLGHLHRRPRRQARARQRLSRPRRALPARHAGRT